MANNKIIINGVVEIDLTADTVTPADVAKDVTFHSASGEILTGTSTKDIDSSSATAAAAEILSGKKAAVRGNMITGTMPNRGAVSGSITTKAGKYTVPQGYHDGSGTVQIASTEQAKIVANNIRSGITILGVTGSMSGREGEKPQAKTVTPTFKSQEILPDTTYTCLSSVTVKAITVTRTDNAAGGVTVAVG